MDHSCFFLDDSTMTGLTFVSYSFSISRFFSHLFSLMIIKNPSKNKVGMPMPKASNRESLSDHPRINLPRQYPDRKPKNIKEMNPKPKAIINLKSAMSCVFLSEAALLNPDMPPTRLLYSCRASLILIASKFLAFSWSRFCSAYLDSTFRSLTC